jgi:hypothetical protein
MSILGMEPLTFGCVAVTITIQIVLLLIWGLIWRDSEVR